MEYSDRPRSGVQPVSTGRERSSSFRDDEWDRDKEDTTSETSSKSDEDSEVSSDDRPLTLEDRALAAKMAADVALDRDTDAEAIAAYDTIASRRRRTAFGAFSSIFAVPTQVLDKVYKNRNSLLTFHPRSEIRLACDRLMKNQHFEMVIFGCVLVNGLVIGLQKPEAQMNAGASAILPETLSTTLQAIFLILFALEASVKIVASGFLIGENTYLREYWNMLDFVVVVAGLVDLASSSAGTALSPLRLIRTLQPLRALNKFKSGRLVLETLGRSLPMLMDVVLFMLWFVVSMTVMGVMFFGNTMTGRTYYPRSEFESEIVNQIVFHTGGQNATEAEFDLARGGYFPQACGVLRTQWLVNNSLGTSSGTAELIAGFTAPSDEHMCVWDKHDKVAFSVTNFSSSATVTITTVNVTNATTGVVTNTTVNTTTTYPGYDQPHMCCDSDLAPFSNYVRFDDFAQGVFVVLQMMTVDGWNEVVWPMCDANGFGKPFVFASAVVVIGGFVVIQLFTSVICATLGDVNQDDGKVRGEKNDVDVVVGAAIGGNLDSVKNSEAAVKIAKFDTEYRSNELATAFRSLVTHAWFDNFIMSCIAINSLMMISSHYDPSRWYVDTMSHLESAFTVIFIVEFTLKHLGLGVQGYWGETWNRLDGFIVLSSVFELVMIEASSGGSGVNLSFLRVFRIFRIIRTFRVLRENKEFVRILESAINGIQAMWVFLVVWALLLIIFAILGVQLFGGRGDLDHERLGFKDVGAALLTLFVVSTGENTFEVAYATMQATDAWSGLYMIAWLVISTAVLSLILGILIDSITAAGDETQAAMEDADAADAKTLSGGGGETKFFDKLNDVETTDGEETIGYGAYTKNPPTANGAYRQNAPAGAKRKSPFDFHKMDRRRVAEVDLVKTRERLERKKMSHSKADVAVVRRWLVSIGETTHTRESLHTENALSAGAKLAARRRLDAFDSTTKKRPGRALSGIGSVEKLHDVSLNETEHEHHVVNPDDEKLAEMKAEISLRIANRQKRRDESVVVIDQNKCRNEHVTWQRVRPPRWKRADLDIVLEDEDGAPKSKIRLKREEEAFLEVQKMHRQNLGVILDVLRIPNPELVFSGGPVGKDQLADGMSTGDAKHDARRKRGWGGGVGLFGLDGGDSRLFTLRLVTHPVFELFVLLSIGVSSGLLAAETHTFPKSGSQTERAFFGVDVVFTGLFTLEMLLKSYAFQPFQNQAAYLRSNFNRLDVVVVAASLLTLIFNGVGALKALRLLRALRPLRSIHRLPSLRIVISAVMASVPAISHVCVLGFGLGTVLSIMGMELFQGKMWYCAWVPSDTVYETFAANVSSSQRLDVGGGLDKTNCLAAGGVWRNNKFNFDNFLEAMVSVFVISTGDNWQDIMYVAMDSVGDGEAPRRDHSAWAAAYFVLCVLVAMLFWANLFVSALVDNFNRMAATGGPTLVSDEQRRWQQAMRLATLSHLERWRLAPPKNASQIRRTVHYYAKQPLFDRTVLCVIFLNLLAMVAYRTNATEAENVAQEVFDYFFTFFYVAEATLLITAMGWRMYWSNFMYKVDFLVAVAGFVDFAVPSLRQAGFGDAFRVARFLRLVKLIKISRGLRTLSLTFIQSLPAVVNISALSALVIFIYACLGVSLYGDNPGPFGASVDSLAFSSYSNFLDFPRAFVVLFVSYTGNWMSYFSDMFRDQRCDALVVPVSAVDSVTGTLKLSCVRDVFAVFYCFTFVVVAIFLLANLFVAVILEQFSQCADAENLFGGGGVADLVITTVQLRKVARLIKGRVVRHKHQTEGGFVEYTSVSKRAVVGGALGLPKAPTTPLTRDAIKTAIAEAANEANANRQRGFGPVEPLEAAAAAVMALVDDAAVLNQNKNSATPVNRQSSVGKSERPNPFDDDDVSVTSDAPTMYSMGAPSQKGDGDSDEEDVDDGFEFSGVNNSSNGRSVSGGGFSGVSNANTLRVPRGDARKTNTPGPDIDLDDML